jgi:hypothetical protein
VSFIAFSHILLLGTLIFKGFTERRFYKSFGVKWFFIWIGVHPFRVPSLSKNKTALHINIILVLFNFFHISLSAFTYNTQNQKFQNKGQNTWDQLASRTMVWPIFSSKPLQYALDSVSYREDESGTLPRYVVINMALAGVIARQTEPRICVFE